MKLLKISLLCIGILLNSSVMAVDIVSVDGQGISREMLEANIASNIEQGQKDTPELRKVILDELVNRLLLAQQAKKNGLTETPEAKLAVKQIVEVYKANLLVDSYLKQHPITDAEVRADYDRQVNALGGRMRQEQISLSAIALPTRNDADEIIAQLNNGSSFEELARNRSLSPSGSSGGGEGWLLPAQMPKEFQLAVSMLGKGGYTKKPLEVQNIWYVLKVGDKRSFKIPTYEESRDEIIKLLIQQRRMALIKEIRESAKITIL